MKKQRGFTLIEVIGVITVLAIILIVAVPSLTKTLKRNEQNKYNDYIDNLKIAAENYVVDKLIEDQFFEEGKDYNYISLGDLIDAGYVKKTITNPENSKILSRDTRVKVYKESDDTYSYDVQEYYNAASDYNKNNLIVHYDSVEYNKDNVFKNLTSEADFDYSSKGYWTEEGIYLGKDNSTSRTTLKQDYETENITISFSIKSLDELGNGSADYSYPVILYNNGSYAARGGFRKNIALFYGSGHNTVFVLSGNLEQNKNYTLTFVQDGLSTRRVYVNGALRDEQNSISATNIQYDEIVIGPKLYDFKLNNVLIYNRALSGEEIQEIYELDKERFGE